MSAIKTPTDLEVVNLDYRVIAEKLEDNNRTIMLLTVLVSVETTLLLVCLALQVM